MNSTAGFVGWAPAPQGRGTIELLWSCSSTIFLGTWTAIHPNLPGLEESKSHIFWRRIGYVVWYLVAPELTAMYAISDFLAVRQIRKKLSAQVRRHNPAHSGSCIQLILRSTQNGH
jgi:hypothetical protein